MIPSRCTVQTPPGVPNSIDENRSSESKHQTTPLHTAIFPRKRKPKIFGFENAMEKEIRKILSFAKLQIASNIFRKIIVKPW